MVGIYKILSPRGKVYIGQSYDIKKRLSAYRKKHCESQSKVFGSIAKYGWDSHLATVIHELPKDVTQIVIDNYEKLYIECYKDCGVELLNIKEGGSSGKHSEDTKTKMKASKVNRIITDEWRKNLRLASNGFSYSDRKVICEISGEVYKNIKEAAKEICFGKLALHAFFSGRNQSRTCLSLLDLNEDGVHIAKHSKEHLQKFDGLDTKVLPRFTHTSAKKIICTKTGKIFNSISAAEKETGLKRGLLGSYLSGYRRNKTTLIFYDGR